MIIFTIAVAALLATLVFWSLRSKPSRLTTTDEPSGDRRKDCLAGKVVHVQNALTPLESRAKPNQRLVSAFGILNCFTTSEHKVCDDFEREARNLINLNRAAWVDIRDYTLRCVDEQLQYMETVDLAQLPLISCVQYTTLKVLLESSSISRLLTIPRTRTPARLLVR